MDMGMLIMLACLVVVLTSGGAVVGVTIWDDYTGFIIGGVFGACVGLAILASCLTS